MIWFVWPMLGPSVTMPLWGVLAIWVFGVGAGAWFCLYLRITRG